MCRDALTARSPAAATSARSTRPPEGEAKRDDENFTHVAVWEYAGRWQGSADRAQGRAALRVREAHPAELQVNERVDGETDEAQAAHLAPEERDPGQGRFRATYTARRRVNEHMSFLEMLDVAQREAGAARARSRSPSITTAAKASAACAAGDQRQARTAPAMRTTVCQLHMRQFKDGDEICIEPWRARLPGDQGSRGRPQGLRPDHPGRRLHQVNAPAAPTPTPSRSSKENAEEFWTPRPASAAAPALPRARTLRPCCSPAPRSRTSALLPQGQAERNEPRHQHGRRRWTRKSFGSLHELRRVHARVLSQGHHRSTPSPR